MKKGGGKKQVTKQQAEYNRTDVDQRIIDFLNIRVGTVLTGDIMEEFKEKRRLERDAMERLRESTKIVMETQQRTLEIARSLVSLSLAVINLRADPMERGVKFDKINETILKYLPTSL